MRHLIYVLLLAATLLAGSSCRPFRRPYNVLLITMDTTRADRLSAYGASPHLAPALDRLARDSVIFERAYTTAPLTTPAHASLFTGRMPFEHGVRLNGEHRLPQSEITLAEILRDNGYETAAFIGAFVLDSQFGLDQGFDHYDDDIEAHIVVGKNRLLRERSAAEVSRRAREWILRRGRRPWFCWVHYFDPHYPYQSWSTVFGARFQDHPYDAEIAYMDLHIGRLLDALREHGKLANTLIVVVADHGESLGEHDEMQHGLTLYESAVRVPLLIALPRGRHAGRRVVAPVSLADIAPTILDLLNIRTTWRASGRSFRTWLTHDRNHSWDRPCYIESHMPYSEYGWAPLAALVQGPWKYIRAPRPELYDVARDPAESHNRIETDSDLATTLNNRLLALAQPGAARVSAGSQLSAEDRRALLSLGYASGRGVAPEPAAMPVSLPDVKDMLSLVQISNEAQTLLEIGKAPEALKLAERLIAQDPANAEFMLLHATALGAVERFDEAEESLKRLYERGRAALTLDTYLNTLKLLAFCRQRCGDFAGAEVLLREALREDPTYVEAANGLAWILVTAPTVSPSHAQEAIALSRSAVEATGRMNASFLQTLATALAAAGQFDEALAVAEEALRRAREHGEEALAADLMQQLELYRN